MFYEGLRFSGGPVSNQLKRPGGSAKEGPHVRGGSKLGSNKDLMNVSRILALGGSICRILYAARRPADPVKSCPCFILRRFLPRASYFDISFCAPFGSLRLSARLIGGGC